MAVNKVVYNTENGAETLIDLTSDSVTPETLAKGATAHDASGNVIEGEMPTDNVRYGQQTLTEAQKAQARANIGAIVGEDLTSVNITDALGFLPADVVAMESLQESQGALETAVDSIREEYAPKNGLTLGVHTDGLVYLFVNGSPQGNGLEIKADVIEGDVFGYVDENNNIVLNGNLADGTYSIKYEMNGETIDIGNLVLDSNVYYSITNTLTNCTNSNSATQAVKGESYSATITANSGYELKSVTVTMGGSPVSVSGGTISIAEVTGNIVITAVAEENKPTYTNLATTFQTGKRYNSSGAIVDNAATCVCEDYIPYTSGTVVRVKGFKDLKATNCVFYLADKKLNTVSQVSARSSYIYDSTNDIVTITSTNGNDHYIRIAGALTSTTDGVIITVNEPIL